MRKNVEENVIRRIRIRDGALILAMAETIIIKVDSITKLSVILFCLYLVINYLKTNIPIR